jgi:AraC-like DNA-binding protein
MEYIDVVAVDGFCLIVSAQGLLLAVLIFTLRSSGGYPQFFLGAFIALESFRLYIISLICAGFAHAIPPLYICSLIYLSGPAIYFYARQINGLSWRWRYGLHCLPWLGAAVLYHLIGALDAIYPWDEPQQVGYQFMSISLAMSAITSIYYYSARRSIAGILAEQSHQASNRRLLVVVSQFLLLLFFIQIIDSLLYVGYMIFNFNYDFKVIFYIVSMLCVFYFVVFNMLEIKVFDAGPAVVQTPALAGVEVGAQGAGVAREKNRGAREKYAKSGLQKERSEDLWTQLAQCLTEKKPYLNVDLDLNTLAAELEIRPQLLSQIINGYAGKSFYEFICEYRINEAIAILSKPKNAGRKLVDIAWSSGFSSHSAFFHHFKRRTGMTPKKFRQLMLGQAMNPHPEDGHSMQTLDGIQ